jgi:hypothetical protein
MCGPNDAMCRATSRTCGPHSLQCCPPGRATPAPYMDEAPVSRVEWDPREKYAGVGFRMVNRLLTLNVEQRPYSLACGGFTHKIAIW